MNELYEGFEIYKKIYDKLAGEKKSLVFGISQHQKTHLAAYSTNKLLYIVSTEEKAQQVAEEISAYGTPAVYLPSKGDVLLNRKMGAYTAPRINALAKILSGEARALVVTVESIFALLPAPSRVAEATIKLSLNKEIDIEGMTKKLVYAGYEKVEGMPKKGEFSIVGDIMRIFAVNYELPIKIEFLYDEVESIKSYTPDVLTIKEQLNNIQILPMSEILLKAEEIPSIFEKIESERKLQNRAARARTDEILSDLSLRASMRPSDSELTWLLPFIRDKLATIFDYVQGFTCFIDEPKQVFEAFSRFLVEHYNRVNTLSQDGEVLAVHKNSIAGEREIMSSLSQMSQIGASAFVEKISASKETFTFASSSLPSYLKNSNMLINFVVDEIKNNREVTIFCEDKDRHLMLLQLLGEQAKKVRFIEQKLPHGFICATLQKTFIGSGDIISKASALRVPHAMVIAPKIGDYVVHDDFGIGRCLGLVHIKNYAGEQDYVAIQYADANKIYLPVHQMDMLSVYNGSEVDPKLSNPNKDEFTKEKAKAKKAIHKMALDLVELYAKRERTHGYKYQSDNEVSLKFDEAFPYEETDGQLAAIADIKEDMEKGKVMDRLICGDVGFGKTEVALRAIFKTVLAGKQVAFLAPTTILAEQHFQTASARLNSFGIKCACLTRFCSPNEAKEILKGVKNGSIGVVIGTHRLLSKDVEFYDIGLLVLDEEQRFGVEHKEKIKALRANINVLSMSATPIPRTLHMSLSGMRDISVLDTPPKGRKPVRTVVCEFTPALLKDAVSAELARGGQVFILYNNISKLASFASEVQEIFPSVDIVCGHGRMSTATLEENIHKFYQKQAQILICTTIIENGIDIPDANTLIVLEANKLGLSQMYQLKGRVGRSERLATAYFTYPEGMPILGDAEKRLNALVDNGDLGSGYRLAMMDLEIRGAGNVLGAEQSGHIEKVGYDMYCTLLRQAIAELNGETLPETAGVEMVVKADAYIPAEYITGEIQRIRYYKKVAGISDKNSKNSLLAEMEEAFGKVPLRVKNLVDIALLKAYAASLNIKSLRIDNSGVVMIFAQEDIATSASVKNALGALSDEIKAVKISGAELSFLPSGASIMARLATATKLLEHILGFVL